MNRGVMPRSRHVATTGPKCWCAGGIAIGALKPPLCIDGKWKPNLWGADVIDPACERASLTSLPPRRGELAFVFVAVMAPTFEALVLHPWVGSWGSAAGEWWAEPAEVKHGEGNERVG